MLILDEISMISLSTLQEIESQLRAVHDSEVAFGGLKVVLFCGDFFQFPPVLGRALWQALPNTDEVSSNTEGKRLWALFHRVILLNEQMRQQDDMEYCRLLRRIRSGTTTMEDYLSLIEQIGIKTLTPTDGAQAHKVIVRCNQLRQHINVISVFEFARSRNQPLFIFMAAHHSTDPSIKVEE